MGTKQWQESRTLLIVCALTAIAVVPAVLATARVTNPWVQGGAAAGGAVFALFAGIWQARYTRIATHRDELATRLEGGSLVLADGRLPKVRQVGDPIALGVHPSIASTDAVQGDERVPVYVPRDIDEELRERLAAGGFLLVVGDSTAGKSRAAYEAMRVTLPDHTLIAPHDRSTLPAAIEQTTRMGKAVLWLGDLERFVGTGGLTRVAIARIVGGIGHHRVILATLRSAEQDRLTVQSVDTDEGTRQAGHDAREVMEQAHAVRVPRLFTRSERERAKVRAWDGRIRAALEQADEFGIAEYLAAAPELQRDMDNAWEADSNPRGAALGRVSEVVTGVAIR